MSKVVFIVALVNSDNQHSIVITNIAMAFVQKHVLGGNVPT